MINYPAIIFLAVGMFCIGFVIGGSAYEQKGYDKGWSEAAEFVEKIGMCSKRIYPTIEE
jgi:hypothetical protein